MQLHNIWQAEDKLKDFYLALETERGSYEAVKILDFLWLHVSDLLEAYDYGRFGAIEDEEEGEEEKSIGSGLDKFIEIANRLRMDAEALKSGVNSFIGNVNSLGEVVVKEHHKRVKELEAQELERKKTTKAKVVKMPKKKPKKGKKKKDFNPY